MFHTYRQVTRQQSHTQHAHPFHSCKRNSRTRANSRSNQPFRLHLSEIKRIRSINGVKDAAGLCRGLLLRPAGGDPHAPSPPLLGVLLVLEVKLNPTRFVRTFPGAQKFSQHQHHHAQMGILWGFCFCCRCRCCSARPVCFSRCSLASSISICSCRHSSLQNGMSPLRYQKQPHRRQQTIPSFLPPWHGDVSNPLLDILDRWWCCCLPVHEDVPVAGQEFPAAEADVEVVVVAVELVGVVAGVAEHAAGPPRRGRRLQRGGGGGGVAGEAGLEVSVSLLGVVVRHFSLALFCVCFLSSANWCSAFSFPGCGRKEVECGEDESEGALYFGGRRKGGRWNFSFWSSVYLWGFINFKVTPHIFMPKWSHVLLLHWAVQQFFSAQLFFYISGIFSTTLRAFVITYK